jgi:hypothetical protein
MVFEMLSQVSSGTATISDIGSRQAREAASASSPKKSVAVKTVLGKVALKPVAETPTIAGEQAKTEREDAMGPPLKKIRFFLN